MTFKEFINKKQQEFKKRTGLKTWKDFADELNVPPTSLSNWKNAGSKPSKEYIDLLVEKFGEEVYDHLGMIRPSQDPKKEINELLELIEEIIQAVPENKRKEFREKIDRYSIDP